jgi:hypothetical protein
MNSSRNIHAVNAPVTVGKKIEQFTKYIDFDCFKIHNTALGIYDCPILIQ